MPARRKEAAIYSKAMRDIYERMKSIGFDRSFIKGAFLPDWWEDSLALQPANRAIAEAAISKWTGIEVADLRIPDRSLRVPESSPVRLKRSRRQSRRDIRPALAVAQRAARLVVRALPARRPYRASLSIPELRDSLLRSRAYIDLESLVSLCWQLGIAVLHVKSLPAESRRFDGVAMYVENTPTIVLGSSRDGPAWLAFHLAHEMAHILMGHVEPGGGALADLDIRSSSEDAQESEADRAAMLLLTGREAFETGVWHGLSGDRLAARSTRIIHAYRIDPGVFALIYGRSSGRWGVAQNALKKLQADHGGQAIVRDALLAELGVGQVSDAGRQFLSFLGAT